jgi:FAD/FMN-containing dehydrogenase
VGLPDAAEAYAALMTLPELGPVAAILVGYNGEPREGERIFEPVRKFGKPLLDVVAPMSHIERQSFIDEGNVEHGPSRYWKSGYTEALTDEFIDAVIAAGESFTSTESSLLFFRVHGAATRVADDATAFSLRREKWDFNVIAQWREPGQADVHKAWARKLWQQLEPLTLGAAYVNHLAADDSAEKLRASFGGNYERLSQIKAKYDPGNLFRINPNIKPA